MDELIEALQIFRKYSNKRFPTNCSHDLFALAGLSIEENQLSESDSKRVTELGFLWSEEFECWISFRFGSC